MIYLLRVVLSISLFSALFSGVASSQSISYASSCININHKDAHACIEPEIIKAMIESGFYLESQKEIATKFLQEIEDQIQPLFTGKISKEVYDRRVRKQELLLGELVTLLSHGQIEGQKIPWNKTWAWTKIRSKYLNIDPLTKKESIETPKLDVEEVLYWAKFALVLQDADLASSRAPGGLKDYSPEEKLFWPVDNDPSISSGFKMRKHPVTGTYRMHEGLDVNATYGTDVIAIKDGEVDYASVRGGFGNHISIKSEENTFTYSHLSEILVEPGDMVVAGQVIGRVGSTGLSTGPHLHLEAKVGEDKVDPLVFLEEFLR